MYQWFSREDKYRDKAQEMSFQGAHVRQQPGGGVHRHGSVLLHLGKLDEAAASGRKAIELDPDDFIAYWTLGRIQFSTGNLAEALELFQRVIEIKPGFYMAHSDLKQTYTGLGRTAEAEAVSRKVLELLPNYLLQNPDDARARMFYAITLLEVGRRDEAIAEGAAALE